MEEDEGKMIDPLFLDQLDYNLSDLEKKHKVDI